MCRMWSRAPIDSINDATLVNFNIEKDLVEVRAGPTTYGVILLGKIRLPSVNDDLGEGFVHVRIHDPPNRVRSFANACDMTKFSTNRVLKMWSSIPYLLTREREMVTAMLNATRPSRPGISLSSFSMSKPSNTSTCKQTTKDLTKCEFLHYLTQVKHAAAVVPPRFESIPWVP